jgi:hypothetical protein
LTLRHLLQRGFPGSHEQGRHFTTRRFKGAVRIAVGSVITKLLPAIVSVAVLGSVVVLDVAVNPTLPEPLPVAPLVIVTHDALLVEDQAQPVVVVTVTVPVLPVPGIAWLVGEMVNAQDPAAWVTVKVLPPIVNVPERDDVVAFAATL